MSNQLLDSVDLVNDGRNLQYSDVILPWERFEGFLWGLPATWWMIVRHPIRAFSAPAEKGWLRALGFSLLICFIVYVPLFLDSHDGGDWQWLFSGSVFEKGFWVSFYDFVVVLSLQALLVALLFTTIPLWFLLRVFECYSFSMNDLARICLYLEAFALLYLIIIFHHITFIVRIIPIGWLILLLTCTWLVVILSADGRISRIKALLVAVIVTAIRLFFVIYIPKFL